MLHAFRVASRLDLEPARAQERNANGRALTDGNLLNREPQTSRGGSCGAGPPINTEAAGKIKGDCAGGADAVARSHPASPITHLMPGLDSQAAMTFVRACSKLGSVSINLINRF